MFKCVSAILYWLCCCRGDQEVPLNGMKELASQQNSVSAQKEIDNEIFLPLLVCNGKRECLRRENRYCVTRSNNELLLMDFFKEFNNDGCGIYKNSAELSALDFDYYKVKIGVLGIIHKGYRRDFEKWKNDSALKDKEHNYDALPLSRYVQYMAYINRDRANHQNRNLPEIAASAWFWRYNSFFEENNQYQAAIVLSMPMKESIEDYMECEDVWPEDRAIFWKNFTQEFHILKSSSDSMLKQLCPYSLEEYTSDEARSYFRVQVIGKTTKRIDEKSAEQK